MYCAGNNDFLFVNLQKSFLSAIEQELYAKCGCALAALVVELLRLTYDADIRLDDGLDVFGTVVIGLKQPYGERGGIDAARLPF